MSTKTLEHVLVVDDEIPLMEALIEALNAQGYVTSGFTTGEEALEALQTQEFDLVLTDLMMPGMDGIALLRAGLAIDPNLVGIIMTGQGTVPTAVEAMKTGAFDYILKPFKMTEILPVLTRAREVRRLRLENIQLRETVAIYNLSQTIAFSLDSKLVLENTADAALQQTDADEASIMLFTPDRQELVVAAVRGKDRQPFLGQRVSIQEGIAGWVARQSEPLILSGEVSDPRFTPLRPRAEIHSAISMPMLAAGKMVGVLNVNTLRPRHSFTPGQIKALSILTSTASAALENEQLYRALERREKHFRALIENSSDAITLLDLQGKFLYASASIQRVLGYAPTELAGQSAFELIHLDDQEAMLSGFMEALQKPGEVGTTELRVRHKDGSWRWIEGAAQNLLEEPAVQALVVNFSDITERKQAEQHLRLQAAIVESASDAIIATDSKFDIVVWNQAAQRIYGRFAEEVMGQPIQKVLPAEFPETTEEAVTKQLWDTGFWSGELLQHRRDGSAVNIFASTSQLKDGLGKLQGAVTVNRDITERKRAVEALRESEAKYRAFFENSMDAILLTSPDGRIQAANPAACKMLGRTEAEICALGRSGLVDTSDPKLAELLEERTRTGKAYGELTMLRNDGSPFPVEMSSAVFQDGQGNTRTSMIIRDITERKRIVEELRQREMEFRSLAENTPDIIARFDDQLRHVYINNVIEEISGMPPQSFIGKSNRDLGMPEEQVVFWDENLRCVFESGQDRTIEFEFSSLTGPRYFESRLIPEFAPTGDVERVLSLARDITERKLAEEKVLQRERELAEAQRVARIGNWMFDSLTRTAHWSDELYRIFGTQRETFDGNYEGFLEFVDPEDRLRMRQMNAAALAGNTPFTFEYRIITPAGERKTISEIGYTITDKAGAVIGLFGTAQDITERKRAEEVLREKEQLLVQAQRIGHVGSWSYEIGADRLQFSDEMYRLLDIPAQEFQHNRAAFLSLIYPADRPATTRWWEDMRMGIQTKELGFRILRRNGELSYLHSTGAVEFDTHGKPTRFIGTLQDITERRLAELQINQQIKYLTTLREIDEVILSSFDLNVTLEQLLSQVISQLQVDAADILLLDADEQRLKYAAGHGFRADAAPSTCVYLHTSHAGRAVKERRLIRVPNLKEQVGDPLRADLLTQEGFIAYFGMPLITKGAVKGVLEVFRRVPLQPYSDWLDFFHALAGQAAIALDNASLFQNLQRSNAELVQAYDATIEGWSHAMDLRDKETEGHTKRVTGLTIELARAMGIDESQLVHIRRGALLHDMGKLGVPDQILFKPGKLTPEEWEVMQKHPEFAYEMLSSIPYLKPALPIPYFHHEKWDGSGYPLGLKGEQIPLEARLFAIVDVWDALTSERPYRPAWSKEEALGFIREQSGKHFDPKVVDLFFKVIR